jgi:hypothetical protein
MSSLPALLVAGLLLAVCGWFAVIGQQVAAQQTHDSPPVEVTTDTLEYCLYLQERLHTLVRMASSPPPREATDLSTEGQHMCDHGQTRGGIMRLRRALLIMQRDDPRIMQHDDSPAER